MNCKSLILSNLCVVSLSLPYTASAAPFLLSENLSGLDSLPAEFADLPTSLDGLNTPFPVDIGVNVINGGFGCLGFGCTNIPTNQKDVFRIEVPVGLQVSNVFIDSKIGHIFQLGPAGQAFTFNAFSSGGLNLTDTLSAGIYDLAILKSSSSGWRWEFTVEAASAVPVPASVFLFSSALISLGFFKRKKI